MDCSTYGKNAISKHLSILVLFITVLAGSVLCQSQAEIEEATMKATALMEKGDYAAAAPYLQKVVSANPDDPDVHFLYGLTLLTRSKQIDDALQGQKLSAEALLHFKEAKRLGMTRPEVDALIQMLGEDPTKTAASSPATVSPAEKYFSQAETYFAQSKYDEALELYRKALDADPKMYEAALYMGDCYTQKQDWDNAERSYQKAIAIDPGRETAYRYSGTPLMKQKKYDLARGRYIEAYITEPYNERSSQGISQWAQVTGAKLSHPKVDIPEIKYDAKGKATTVINENSLSMSSKAWIAYTVTRENWHREKFGKSFPNESVYRHTLQEEVDAIRSVLKKAKDEKLTHPDFEILQKLDSAGLLESFILLARPDEGIAKDYAAYLKDNRPKLRQYVADNVIQK